MTLLSEHGWPEFKVGMQLRMSSSESECELWQRPTAGHEGCEVGPKPHLARKLVAALISTCG